MSLPKSFHVSKENIRSILDFDIRTTNIRKTNIAITPETTDDTVQPQIKELTIVIGQQQLTRSRAQPSLARITIFFRNSGTTDSRI